MYKLRRWYNQNRKTIWKVIGIVVFLIAILQLLNYIAGRNNKIKSEEISSSQNNNLIQTNEYTDLSLETDKSVLSDEEISTSQSKEIKVIDTFMAYCNNKDTKNAYDMLTDECKEEMYPKLDDFKNSYYKKVFNGEKKNISLENWNGSIYKVSIGDDILSTGQYNEDSIRQDYITVKEVENDNYKLNINGYIGQTEINKSCNSVSNIELIVKDRDRFMDYEIYTFEIKNNTDSTILLDNLKDVDSMYLEDSNNLKYSAYTNEISLSELLIKSKETRKIKVKYYNKYNSNRQIKNIIFSKVITNYTSDLALEDYYTLKDYCELKIEL